MSSDDSDGFSLIKYLGIGFGVLVFLSIAIAWISADTQFSIFKYFAPKEEAVRRETFEQSKAYNQGMVQEIQNMQFQYVGADAAHKAALADLILHRVADYDLNKLPPDTRDFVMQLKKERLSK